MASVLLAPTLFPAPRLGHAAGSIPHAGCCIVDNIIFNWLILVSPAPRASIPSLFYYCSTLLLFHPLRGLQFRIKLIAFLLLFHSIIVSPAPRASNPHKHHRFSIIVSPAPRAIIPSLFYYCSTRSAGFNSESTSSLFYYCFTRSAGYSDFLNSLVIVSSGASFIKNNPCNPLIHYNP